MQRVLSLPVQPPAIKLVSIGDTVGKGFWNAMADTSCRKGFIVYPGDKSYPVGKKVVSMPAGDVSRIWE